MAPNGRVIGNDELGKMWKESFVAYLRYNPAFTWMVWGNSRKLSSRFVDLGPRYVLGYLPNTKQER
jgi:hypothetical protein